MRTISINKRSELNKYFDQYGKGGFEAGVRQFEDDLYVVVVFHNDRNFRLLVPFIEMVYYAGFLPKKHTFQDSVDEVRRVQEATNEFYRRHGHYSYEACSWDCRGWR